MEKNNQNPAENPAEEFTGFKCSRCKSAFGYVQIKTNHWKCRKCNFEEPLENKQK